MSTEDLFNGTVCVFIKLAAVAGGLFLLRKYMKGRKFSERVDATGKVALVTGASSGIGKYIAAGLNTAGAKVYLLCRSRERGNKAIDDLVKEGCDRDRLLLRIADLTSFDSVRGFASAFAREERSLDILVNNAAVMALPSFVKTIDGHEVTFQTNHLSHFLLTDLLLEMLRASGNARVVNVASEWHMSATSVRESDVSDPAKYSMRQPYCRSKLANVMHARWLTELWEEAGEHRVTANSCHPGAVRTNLVRYSIFGRQPFKTLLQPIYFIFFRSEKEGAQTPLYVTLSRELEGVSGKYFDDCREAKPNPVALDDAACRELFEYSARAVHLSLK